ncbi:MULTISPECIES: branched-chain amino acid ABC transporter permease [Amycolatopsis methanolica group]|uniref:branched-chain amino acid ABC transporter permease n=1 Tax=Amycolatopsis methanolica group TaxID=2893674 RepID=UPI00341A3EFA
MDRLLQACSTGLGSAAIYAIIGMGFSLVFKTTRVVNFAHGGAVVAAGILGSVLQREFGWPLVPVVLAVIVAGVAFGLATETVAVRMLGSPSPLTITIGTVALGIVLEAVLLETTGGATYGMTGWPGPALSRGSVSVPAQTIGNVALAVVVAVVLTVFFSRTRRGVVLQAGADDRDTATLFGVSYRVTTLWTFGLAGALAALAGLAMTPVTLVTFNVGFLYGLKGFAAAMVGGLGSVKGALAGGVPIGITESVFATYVTSNFAPVVAFLVLLVVLVFRPQGMFKELAVERV